VAFALGCLVYFKWRSRASLWVWALGLTGFAWRVLLGNNPPSLSTGALWATLVFLSLKRSECGEDCESLCIPSGTFWVSSFVGRRADAQGHSPPARLLYPGAKCVTRAAAVYHIL
jgi:hypothetical protein